jgi:hypothetical protein
MKVTAFVEQNGCIRTDSQDYSVLFRVRQAQPLSLYMVLKLPKGRKKTEVLEEDQQTNIPAYVYEAHRRAARNALRHHETVQIDALIGRSERNLVPDEVYESATHRSVHVHYGKWRISFFRSSKDPKGLTLSKITKVDLVEATLQKERISGKVSWKRPTQEHLDEGREWALKLIQVLPRSKGTPLGPGSQMRLV